jgi:sulfate adenylyltransferase subunit 2
MTPERMTHLKQLEAESIHIMREVAAEFDNPVMLYSVGQGKIMKTPYGIRAQA